MPPPHRVEMVAVLGSGRAVRIDSLIAAAAAAAADVGFVFVVAFVVVVVSTVVVAGAAGRVDKFGVAAANAVVGG